MVYAIRKNGVELAFRAAGIRARSTSLHLCSLLPGDALLFCFREIFSPYNMAKGAPLDLFITPGSWLEEILPSSVTVEDQVDLSPPASVHINHRERFCAAQSQSWACHIAVTGSTCPVPSPLPRPATSGVCVCVWCIRVVGAVIGNPLPVSC